MGTVTYVDFKTKQTIKMPDEPEIQTNVAPIIPKRNVVPKVQKEVRHYTGFMRLLLSKHTEQLMSLEFSASLLKESRHITKNYSTDELISWLEETDRKVWKENPAFFQAIFQELKERLNLN